MCRTILKIILTISVCCALCACNPDDALTEQSARPDKELQEQISQPEDEVSEQENEAEEQIAALEEETPEQTAGQEEKPEQMTPEMLLENALIDEKHDAFLVDTGGDMGTLFITAERSDEQWGEVGWYKLTFSVWDPADMEQPLQTILMDDAGMGVSDSYHCVDDFNFDGFQDFSYLSYAGNQPNYWEHWLWDEENGQFSYYEPLTNVSGPIYDADRQVVHGWERSSAVSGVETYFRWVDGELTLMRAIIYHYPDYSNRTDGYDPQIVTVEDLIDGQMTEVYRNEVNLAQLDGQERIDPRWRDLDYHGEK